MRRTGLLVAIAIVIAIALLALSPTARADESPTHQLARKHYELGKTYYQVSNYTAALAEFDKAYALEPLPGLVYNIARCHEVLGNLKEAIAKYRLFVEKSPSSPERATVELKIKNLEVRRQQQTPQPGPNEPTRPSTLAVARGESQRDPVPPPPVAGEGTRRRSWKRPAGWAVLSVGAAALITGVISGALVSSKSDEFKKAADEGRSYQTLLDLRAAGDRYQQLEIATLVIGGVGLAAGGGLLLWELLGRREAPATRTSLLPFGGPGGFGLNLSSRF